MLRLGLIFRAAFLLAFSFPIGPAFSADLRGKSIHASFSGAPFTFNILKSGEILIHYAGVQPQCPGGGRLGYRAALNGMREWAASCAGNVSEPKSRSVSRFDGVTLDIDVVIMPTQLRRHFTITLEGNTCSGSYTEGDFRPNNVSSCKDDVTSFTAICF